MTTFISGHCMSAGSIMLQSDLVLTQASYLEQSYAGSRTAAVALIAMLALVNPNERQIPAAPFDSPSMVPLYSHASEPVHPRKTIFVKDLGDPRVSLIASIPVALDFWRDSVTACCYDLEDFGVGPDEFSALADLKASLVELYFVLKAEAKNLGPLPQRHWNYLRGITREN